MEEVAESTSEKRNYARTKEVTKSLTEKPATAETVHTLMHARDGAVTKKRRWTEEELKVLFEHFSEDIRKKTMPDGKRLAVAAQAMSNSRIFAQICSQVNHYVRDKVK